MVKNILLVDDDAELCRELAEILRDEGYCVDDLCDSLRAAALIKERSYDIFLFDYKMAGLSGVDLIRLVKEKDPSGKIFVISGRLHIEKILQKENVASLVAGVVPKPFDAAVLLDKIKAALA